MKEYVKNTKKYVKNNMKEYEEICQYIGFGTPISIWTMGLRRIPISPPLHGPWDLEKFLTRTSSWALGLGKISIFIPTSTYTKIGSGTKRDASSVIWLSP